MSRIYNGFDALALGQAVNKMHQGYADRTNATLQNFGNGLQTLFQAIAEERQEQNRKKSALEYLLSRGGGNVDRRQAESIVGALGPENGLSVLLGEISKKEADTANAEKEAAQKKSALEYLVGAGKMDQATAEGLVGSVGAGEAAKYMAGRISSGEDYARNRKDATLDRVYSSLTQSLDLLRSKAQTGTFTTQEDVKALRDAEAKLAQFVKEYPEYAAGNPQESQANEPVIDETYFSSDAAPMTTERMIERVKSVFDENDTVAPEALDMLDKEFIRNYGVSIYNVPEVKDLVELATMSQKGGKLDRLRKNLKAGGKGTKDDAQRNYDNAQFAKNLANYVKQLEVWRKAKKGTVRKPTIPDEYLTKMSKKQQNIYRSY